MWPRRSRSPASSSAETSSPAPTGRKHVQSAQQRRAHVSDSGGTWAGRRCRHRRVQGQAAGSLRVRRETGSRPAGRWRQDDNQLRRQVVLRCNRGHRGFGRQDHPSPRQRRPGAQRTRPVPEELAEAGGGLGRQGRPGGLRPRLGSAEADGPRLAGLEARPGTRALLEPEEAGHVQGDHRARPGGRLRVRRLRRRSPAAVRPRRRIRQDDLPVPGGQDQGREGADVEDVPGRRRVPAQAVVLPADAADLRAERGQDGDGQHVRLRCISHGDPRRQDRPGVDQAQSAGNRRHDRRGGTGWPDHRFPAGPGERPRRRL